MTHSINDVFRRDYVYGVHMRFIAYDSQTYSQFIDRERCKRGPYEIPSEDNTHLHE